MNFYWKIGFAAAAFLLAAILAVTFLMGGEAEEIEAVLDALVNAARKGDAEEVIAFVSPSYESDGQSYEDVCRLIRRVVGPGRYRDIEIRDREIIVMGDSAGVVLRIRLVQPEEMGSPYIERTIRAEFRREGETWKVLSAKAEAERQSR